MQVVAHLHATKTHTLSQFPMSKACKVLGSRVYTHQGEAHVTAAHVAHAHVVIAVVVDACSRGKHEAARARSTAGWRGSGEEMPSWSGHTAGSGGKREVRQRSAAQPKTGSGPPPLPAVLLPIRQQ